MEPLEVYHTVVDSFLRVISAPVESDFPANVWTMYTTMDPLAVAVLIVCAYAMYAFLGSLVTGDCSIVDRSWSIVPMVYSWIFALHPSEVGKNDQSRPILIAVLVTLWGIRLTYNFWRKGGYSGEEDYRWPIIRQRIPGPLFVVFNFVFIAWFQHALLLAITVPAYVSRRHGSTLNWLDVLAAVLFVCFLVLETVSDQQQWTFQQEKYARKREGRRLDGDFAIGFRTTGLFRYSRHPNFFSEQAMWCCVYLFSVAATGVWLNWSITGCLVLIGLFQGSTMLTESLSSGKYPMYLEYQKTTSRFIPLPPSGELPRKDQ